MEDDFFGEDEIFYEEEDTELSIQYLEELEYDEDPFFNNYEEEINYQEQLANIPMREIEIYLRRKKLENIKKNENT